MRTDRNLQFALMLGLTTLAVEVWAGPGAASPQAVSTAAASGTVSPIPGVPPEVAYAIGTLGFGGLAGWSVGFTLKKAAKIFALIIGIVFISVQALAYKQFISVDWNKIQGLVPNRALEEAWTGGMSILTYNVPFAGAFLLGFLMGFRKG